MNKNNITHPENMNTEDTKKEMIPSAFPPKENGEHSNRKSLSIAFYYCSRSCPAVHGHWHDTDA